MRAVFLDAGTVDAGDVDLSPLQRVADHWDWYRATGASELPQRLATAQVAVTNKVVLDAAALAAAPRLALVCVAATGYDNVDLAAAAARGVTVCNVRGYATAAVAQHTMMLLLALAGRLPQYRQAVAAGQWSRAGQFCLVEPPILELSGRVLGIVGYGAIGRAVAEAATALGMQVRIAERPGQSPRAGRQALAELVREADVLSLHCPLTGQTRGLVDAALLAAMKPGALVINTARGALVDEPALAAALRSGHLGGAGLDVLGVEPPPASHSLLAPDIPNLILTPHCAWASRDARQRLIGELAANIEAFRAGQARNRLAPLASPG